MLPDCTVHVNKGFWLFWGSSEVFFCKNSQNFINIALAYMPQIKQNKKLNFYFKLLPGVFAEYLRKISQRNKIVCANLLELRIFVRGVNTKKGWSVPHHEWKKNQEAYPDSHVHYSFCSLPQVESQRSSHRLRITQCFYFSSDTWVHVWSFLVLEYLLSFKSQQTESWHKSPIKLFSSLLQLFLLNEQQVLKNIDEQIWKRRLV